MRCKKCDYRFIEKETACPICGEPNHKIKRGVKLLNKLEYFITFEWLFDNINFSRNILIMAIFFILIGAGFYFDPLSLLDSELERYTGVLIIVLSFNLIPAFILMKMAEKNDVSADNILVKVTTKNIRKIMSVDYSVG